MTTETSKRLERLSNRWANEPYFSPYEREEMLREVMDALPDLIAAVKEGDEQSLQRIGCEYAMTELRRRCGLNMESVDLSEVWLHIEGIMKERDAALKACEQIKTELCREQEKLKMADEDRVRENLAYLLREKNNAEQKCAEMLAAVNEAWNAFDNGRRKHHADPLTGGCILGCQACAVEKLKQCLSTDCGKGFVPRAELDAAQKACAEMRDVLSGVQRGIIVESTGDESCPVCLESYCNSEKECDGDPVHTDDCKLYHALSTNCGRGYHHDRDCEPLVRAIQLFVDWCKTPECAVTPEVIEAQHEALAHWEKVKGQG